MSSSAVIKEAENFVFMTVEISRNLFRVFLYTELKITKPCLGREEDGHRLVATNNNHTLTHIFNTPMCTLYKQREKERKGVLDGSPIQIDHS